MMAEYDFKDVSSRHLNKLRYCFADSKILKPNIITNDVFIMMPQIKSTELLYRMGRDGCSAEIFHKKCDDHGPTLTLINANGGYIFGGYSPTSWINSFSYSDCEDAFLISFCDD